MKLRVQEYIDGVKSGEITACKQIKQAVDRYERGRDNERSEEFPFYFDEEEARRVIDFFGYLHHWKGEWAGKPIILEPWQQFYLWDLFGWKRVDDKTRRYRKSGLWIARKNGKTTMAAGIGLYGLMKDGEQGPQIYSVATKAEQSAICFNDAKNITGKSKSVKNRLDSLTYSLSNPANMGFFKYFGADSSTMDGFDPYYCIADEVHAHKSAKVLNVMESGMGTRQQPMMIEISTTGYLLNGIGKQHYDYSEKVLRGVIEDEAWHAMIFTLDKDDDWKDPSVWIKSNPNLGTAKKWSYMEGQLTQAMKIPSKAVDFKTKDLNLWVSSKTGYIPHEAWDRCNKGKVSLDDFEGREVKMALDLGEVKDFTAFGLLGLPRHDGDDYIVKMWYWIPELTLKDRKNADVITPWCGEWITTTDGNATDFDHVKDDIWGIVEYGVQTSELHYDPNKGQQIPQHIAEMEILPVSIPQSYKKLNPGVDEMERLTLGERVNYGNDPVIAWMNSNVVVTKNRDGYRKFDKGQSQDKIDGMVVLEMLFAQAATKEEEEYLDSPVH